MRCEFGNFFFSLPRYHSNNKTFKELVGFWINNLSIGVPDSVVLPVGTHMDCSQQQDIAEMTHGIMARITAMLAERKQPHSLHQQPGGL